MLSPRPSCLSLGPESQMGWHSPRHWGRPGLGIQSAAPSWHTHTVQASGSQRAPSGQARPSPQHWGGAGRHSQDSSRLTLSCRSLFWSKELGRGAVWRCWLSFPYHPPQGRMTRRAGVPATVGPLQSASSSNSHGSQDLESGQAPRGAWGPLASPLDRRRPNPFVQQ